MSEEEVAVEWGGIPSLLFLFPGKATPPCSWKCPLLQSLASHYEGKKVPAESGDAEKGSDNFSNYWHSLLLLLLKPHFGVFVYVAYQLQRVLSFWGSLSGDIGYVIRVSNI